MDHQEISLGSNYVHKLPFATVALLLARLMIPNEALKTSDEHIVVHDVCGLKWSCDYNPRMPVGRRAVCC